MSYRMAHNTDRFVPGCNAEMLAFEAARLNSTMDEVEAYINLYGTDPVALESDGDVITAPAYEAQLEHHRRLGSREL